MMRGASEFLTTVALIGIGVICFLHFVSSL